MKFEIMFLFLILSVNKSFSLLNHQLKFSFFHPLSRSYSKKVTKNLQTLIKNEKIQENLEISQKDLEITNKKKIFYILDGTSMLYRSFYGLESQKKFKNYKTNLNIPCSALISLIFTFLRFLRDIQPFYIATVFDSGGKTFRNQLFKEYKQQRVKVEEILILSFFPFIL